MSNQLRQIKVLERIRSWRQLPVGLVITGLMLGLAVVGGMGGEASGDAVADDSAESSVETEAPDAETSHEASAADMMRQAEVIATETAALLQTAETAEDWDRIARQWVEAIALLQSIPPDNPSRIVAQRQLHSYLQQLQDAQQRAAQASLTSGGLPSLGSDILDAQLAGYLSYVATVGTPDVLIVGSSRSLQGIDPQKLQQTLAARGYEDLTVFNFSVNGATAQVVEFIVGQLLPEPLPEVIVWGDGSRAFNEGRRDRTWEKLLASPGYQQVTSVPGSLSLAAIEQTDPLAQRVTARSPLVNIPGNLDALGFSAVSDRFDPQTYYQQTPQVAGRYDGAYAGFSLNGPQADALGRIAAIAQAKDAQLLFVNLPLSGSYLDDFRWYYEQQFQQFLQTQSEAHGFEVIDLLTQWENQPGFFADPSHINREGAGAIARQLAQSPKIVDALSTPAAPASSPMPDLALPRPSESLSDSVEPDSVEPAPPRRPPPPVPPPPARP